MTIFVVTSIITPPLGWGVVIPFFCGHLPQTPDFCSAKQISVANLHYTAWAHILSDRNIFCILRGGRTTAGYNAPGAFLVLILIYFVGTTSCQLFP